MIAMGGGLFELDRKLGVIRIKDFMNNLEFTPATLAYVLQQYGPFGVTADISSWRLRKDWDFEEETDDWP